MSTEMTGADDIVASKESSINNTDSALSLEPKISIKVAFGKTSHVIPLTGSNLVKDLKLALSELTGIEPSMQKLLFKGVLKDDQTIAEANIKDGSKVMMMASTAKDLLNMATVATTPASPSDFVFAHKTALCTLTEHKKIIDKGKPTDAEKGVCGLHLPIPPRGVSGLLNSRGGKTRLVFRLELDELCISTNDNTQKIPLSSIAKVVCEPIIGHDGYSMMGFQLGPTEKSTYWVYFVPDQFTLHIQQAISW
ncbi:Ubiquitin domain-containing protein ubfd1 [Batrachochytrium dendrobatidis]|nr:Ubiquitin domain-containing protein ubfd1 [Batrachochytrium dendrobatidis]KAK5665648.1 Ubiquitin domain-containing protein ubfd1 [Batrachochytrium dendrobatidis]OAJ42581.1 hypothetical protein BDEG_26024 [Batrachochytrium dendrobatidis JEL423]